MTASCGPAACSSACSTTRSAGRASGWWSCCRPRREASVVALLQREWHAEALAQRGAGQRLGERALRDRLPALEQQRVRRARGDLVDVVGDEHERRAGGLTAELGERNNELFAPAQVEPG